MNKIDRVMSNFQYNRIERWQLTPVLILFGAVCIPRTRTVVKSQILIDSYQNETDLQ